MKQLNMKFLFILLTLACTPSLAQKKLLKQASALEANQQYALASEKYKEVLYKNAGKVEALSGLERTAQKVMDTKLSAYFISRNSDNVEEAIQTFESILRYQEELKYFNINLQVPDYYYSDYEEDKRRLISNEKKQKQDQFETKYLEARQLYEESQWIDAWEIFNSLATYKDAKDFRKRIESHAKRISLVENNKNRLSNENVLRNNLQSEIVKLKNPFIRLINRDNLDQVIEEQKLGLSGLFDEQSAAELGKLLGVELMLLTSVMSIEMQEPTSTTQNKTAYVASTTQVYDPVTQTTNNKREYFPVAYQEHIIYSKLEISFQYQLIDVSTAEVLTAAVLHENYENHIQYGSYSGDPNLLYPSNGASIYTKGKERDEFLVLFSKDSRALSRTEMESVVHQELSKKVAAALDAYFRYNYED